MSLYSSDFKDVPMSKAVMEYACHGNGDARLQRFAPGCTRRIERGSSYIAKMAYTGGGIVSRHCADCALTFFPAVYVGGEKAVMQ